MSVHMVRLLAPAKINLHLRVGPLGADGFHPLLSWMTGVGLFDKLTLSAIPQVLPKAGDQWVELQCDDASLPCDQNNLVVGAGQMLASALEAPAARETRAGQKRGDAAGRICRVSAALQKRIPTGAGLGGGSSDAASALRGLAKLWNAGLDRAALAGLSLSLGSDVPFFFHGSSSLCRGRGQFVHPTPPPQPRWALLALPAIHVSTPAVYRTFDQMGLGDARPLQEEPDWAAWAKLPARQLLELLVNDLEKPAFAVARELGPLRQRLEAHLGQSVRMSGSGSSLFTLSDDQASAEIAAKGIGNRLHVSALAVPIAPSWTDDAPL